jgi:hypothetical protein
MSQRRSHQEAVEVFNSIMGSELNLQEFADLLNQAHLSFQPAWAFLDDENQLPEEIPDDVFSDTDPERDYISSEDEYANNDEENDS